MKRRHLLTQLMTMGATFALWPMRGLANTVLSQLGPSTPIYIQMYFQRLLKFSEKEFYSFSKSLNTNEKKLVEAWNKSLKEWGLQKSERFFEFFLFSHELKSKKINSSRLAIGHNQWTPELRDLVNNVLKSRNLPQLASDTETEKFFGLGWDLELGQIKVYKIHTTTEITDPHLSALSQKHSDQKIWNKERISVVTYQNGKVVKKKLIVPLKEIDWSLISSEIKLDVFTAMKVLDCGPHGEELPVRWHFRLRSFFLGQADPKLHPIISKHYTEFDQLMDSVIYESPEKMTVYYP